MIYVKSFVSVESAVYDNKKAVKRVVEEATEEMQCWIDKEEDFVETHFVDGFVKVISTSTHLVVNEDIVSYAITAVIEQDGKEE